MTFPKYGNSNIQERHGVNAVAQVITKLGLIWRETPMADIGIDGQVEYVDKDGNATGRTIAVQIKSGPSYFKETKNNWFFYLEEKHRLYWERYPIPVLIIIHNPETELSYWLDIRQKLRTPSKSEVKGIHIPKTNILQEASSEILFQGFAVSEQSFLDLDNIVEYMINTHTNTASFPVSYFSLFSAGLTNICRSLYFGMDVALNIVEVKSPAYELTEKEREFLFGYIQFLVNQHIADIDYSDCIIDWNERQMLPMFMAPLTSRGRELVEIISNLESEYREKDLIPFDSSYHVAQESFVQSVFTESEVQRIKLVEVFEKLTKA